MHRFSFTVLVLVLPGCLPDKPDKPDDEANEPVGRGADTSAAPDTDAPDTDAPDTDEPTDSADTADTSEPTDTGSPSTVCPDGMVAWWRGEGDASDSWGGHHGVAGDAVSFAPGQVGNAMVMAGEGVAVEVSDHADFQFDQSFSIEVWLRLDAYPSYPTWGIGQILFRGDDQGGFDPYYLSVMADETIRFHMEDESGWDTQLEAPVALETMTHVVAVYNGEPAVYRQELWLDGALVAETINTNGTFTELPGAANGGLGIGDHQGGYHTQPLEGLIDELTVYGRALSETEIGELHTLGLAGQAKCGR
jgi:hypothetical protein